MRVAFVIIAGMMLFHRVAHAELDDKTRQLAIHTAFGLGCAVQDRDEFRANAWAQVLMGAVGELASRDPEIMGRAGQFAAYVNSTFEQASRGGFNCKGFPKLPEP